MADEPPSRADLIGKTRGAQTRDQALEHVRRRRAGYASKTNPPKEATLSAAEELRFKLPPPPPPPKPKAPAGKKGHASERPPRPHPPHKTKKDVPFRVIEGGKDDPKAR
jgi:hypothetical protein